MKILELYKEIKEDLSLETETILEEHSLDSKYADAVSALKTIVELKELNDYYAFQKICLALAFKDVDFKRKQEPTVMDIIFAYVFCKSNMKIGDEVISYIASKCIYDNWLMLPKELKEIQSKINTYLVQNNRYDLLKRISSAKFEEDFQEGSLEYFQKEKYLLIETEILKEI